MITLEYLYVFAGLIFAGFALLSARDRANARRFGNAVFWGLMAFSFLMGSHLTDFQNGVLALLLVLTGGFNFLGKSVPPTTSRDDRIAGAYRRGNGLFAAALIIPGTALLGTLLLRNSAWIDPKQITIICLGFGVVAALAVAMLWLKPPALAPLQEGRRLADAIGWALILPQMLAALGAVFAAAGVGTVVGTFATTYLPLGAPLAAVLTYCVGMAVFTALLGNAFAAFPVMTAAIGLPLIVGKFHGDVTIMAAIGMLAGFCGTLTTPMAANFNIVPAALLELPDRNGVIKVQLPTALWMLLANILLMYGLVFRF